MMYKNMIKSIQKLSVVGATGMAALPLYEWYDEKGDRRIERVAGFISAGDICKEWLRADFVNAMILEATSAAEKEEDYVPLPVQWRANMAIFCAEMFDYLQNDFSRHEEPAAEEYADLLSEAEFWSSPVGFDAYLTIVHENPELAGTHESYAQKGY